MQLSRRGFLHTMVAAAVGSLATFDPKSLLWVPGNIDTITTATNIDEQLELNDLALRFVRMMGERLARNESRVVRTIMCQHAGHVRLREVRKLAGLIDLEGVGRGHFEPSRARVFKAGPMKLWKTSDDFLADMAGQLHGAIAYNREIDMFAPIGPELRPGEPFSNALVGLATDPETGLSARAIRVEQVAGMGRASTITAFEMAPGRWYQAGQKARPSGYDPHQRRIFLAGEQES